jgi:folate-binding protein YgfZ
MTDTLHGVARLDHLGVIRIQGEDAVHFLQGQLTQDFALLGDSQARLAGYCTAKGRMLASFVGFKVEPNGAVLLICGRDLLPSTLKRLSMFVLRAKARLSDATAEFALYGLLGNVMDTAAGGALAAWQLRREGAAVLVGLPAAKGQTRGLLVTGPESAAPAGPAISLEQWLWTEVASGVAPVTTPTVEAFVPQMLNYESVGGVSFKKGCYPGQEIVARSQFRGTIKRRACIVHSDAPLAAGDEIFNPTGSAEACGITALAAAAPGGGWDAIVSILTSAAATGQLNAGAIDGPALQLRTLPYELLEDL